MDQQALTRNLWFVLSTVVAGFVIVTLFSLLGLEHVLTKEKQQQTQNLVDSAYSLLEHYHQQQLTGQLSESEAKARAVAVLESMRYDNGNYFWLHDLDYRMVMHPFSHDLMGAELDQVQDQHGRYLFREMQQFLTSEGEGVVSYVWPKPGTQDASDKISFVKLFSPWGWAIGSGVYVDDIHETFTHSAIFLVVISSSVVLMVFTAGFLIRRETRFQRSLLALTQQNNLQLEAEVDARTLDLSSAYEDIKQSREQALEDKRKAQYNEALFRGIASAAQDAMILIDHNGNVRYWNPAATRIFGYTQQEVQGKDLHGLITRSQDQQQFQRAFPGFRTSGQGPVVGIMLEVVGVTKSGDEVPVELSINSVKLDDEWQAIGIVRDISERKKTERELHEKSRNQEDLIQELKMAQDQLVQSEKMAAIGQLSAGVAHEINNPVGFIGSNLNTLEGYLEHLIEMYEQTKTVVGRELPNDELLAQIASIEEQHDLSFMKEDLIDIFAETQEGILRIRRIVTGLKGFSRSSTDVMEAVDINAEIETTLNIVWNELKYHCQVEKEFAQLPMVECLSSEIGQVMMNLLMNASQAIEGKGIIRIRTALEGERVRIQVSDNGQGIQPEHLGKVFDPFFTTKPVGKGTGLGLSVSYGIIQKHRGRLEVESTVGKGTTFTIELPLTQAAAS
ncbi:cache domain-containing protein [Motiliproteus sp.]|uniref:cache domain-containing protein n=1 Tax=Motiliproteus sp. TaxID=1898955 RepID=UPI003BAABEEE